MATSQEQEDAGCEENNTCIKYKIAEGVCINREHYISESIIVDKTALVNLQDDIKKLSSMLQLAMRSSGEEVMQHKINTMLIKMASIIEDSPRTKEQNVEWIEAKKGKSKIIRKQYDQYAIPVINNRYAMLENHVEDCENSSLVREFKSSFGKVERGKKKKRCERNRNRVLFLGDSHARGMASEVKHKLGKNFDVFGIVKPGSNMKELTNTLNSTVSALSKNDVCIIWGGSCDIAKNESEYGLQQVKDLATKLSYTNLVVINAPFRHDLQENSCVNSAVKGFNRKLSKYSKAFENLQSIEVVNCRELYSNHGLHLNWRGREAMTSKIVNVINDILNVQKPAPIVMEWKEERKNGPTLPENCEIAKGKNNQCFIVNEENMQVYREIRKDDNEPENETVLQSKRLRKVPKKRSSDFLWIA